MEALGCSGADVDEADKQGGRPTHDAAVSYNGCGAASDLLESGVAHGAPGLAGSQALHQAACRSEGRVWLTSCSTRP